jgi:hypothetical protein
LDFLKWPEGHYKPFSYGGDGSSDILPLALSESISLLSIGPEIVECHVEADIFLTDTAWWVWWEERQNKLQEE